MVDAITLLITFVDLSIFVLAIQIHLEEFELSQNAINYLYSSYCIGYFVMSLVLAVFHRYGQLGMMVLGMAGMGVSLLLMSPWDLVLDRNYYYIVVSIPLFGIMLAALYGKE